MGVEGDPRARLEQQAAAIIGRARQEASDLLREARQQADELIRRAEERAERVRAEGDAHRDEAHRELVLAQERALVIRSEAQRTADAIVERATLRARTEADELLQEARRQLAQAVAGVREAEVAAQRIRDAMPALDVIDIRNPDAPVVTHVAEVAAAAPAAAPAPAAEELAAAPGDVAVLTEQPAMSAEELRAWIEDMSDERVDFLIAGAVAAAVRKALSPVVVRAGRYTVLK